MGTSIGGSNPSSRHTYAYAGNVRAIVGETTAIPAPTIELVDSRRRRA